VSRRRRSSRPARWTGLPSAIGNPARTLTRRFRRTSSNGSTAAFLAGNCRLRIAGAIRSQRLTHRLRRPRTIVSISATSLQKSGDGSNVRVLGSFRRWESVGAGGLLFGQSVSLGSKKRLLRRVVFDLGIPFRSRYRSAARPQNLNYLLNTMANDRQIPAATVVLGPW